MIDLPDAPCVKRSSDLADAVFSACNSECFRYVLRRSVPPTFGVEPGKSVAFVMLNPSIATETVLDPTIRRCLDYAQQWGYSDLYVVNLFALRSTDPKELYAHDEPIGQYNDDFIDAVAEHADLVIMAWGVHGKHKDRGATVRARLRGICKPHYLKLTKAGQPWHPLMLRADLKPIVDKCDALSY